MTVYNINGIKIFTSNQGKSGYKGATFSPAWTLNEDFPFIAMAANPTDDPNLSKWLTAKKRASLHLGTYSDSREAAYVYSLYIDNPEQILRQIYHKVFVPNFPNEIYDLPVYLTKEDAKGLIVKFAKKTHKAFKPKPNKVLAIAREYVKTNDLKVHSYIRKQIDIYIKAKKYISDDCIRSHIDEILEEIT
jgi:hypothetical protein